MTTGTMNELDLNQLLTQKLQVLSFGLLIRRVPRGYCGRSPVPLGTRFPTSHDPKKFVPFYGLEVSCVLV
ncbi:hypothetical protein SAMN05216379_12620 [Nitrosomonas eutropha]|uniref:hypothetical protein n=1 Tax=Nitrosomonas eutropha TaxID=916 RepID=UPI0008805C96|nr:hypothetical protein [Nitrosomonas eutropha]SCX25181.1 hypothetical protein SAMN05216379_12620 [Nitrosomonas eutropha]